MIKNLVIVESPAKAKTIEKFLGEDYTVRSCYGHIRDLAEDGLSVDVNKGFEPHYVVPEEKKKVVSELKKLAQDAENIWLATDEDREGEAISWHLAETLGLDHKKVRRIVFHEITKPAILRAINQPRSINKDLVDAQQARRILDRLVGFELSPVLWKKIQPALSAGRVQSVAVRLIVEREREINNFQYKSSFKITAQLEPLNEQGKPAGGNLKAELPKSFATEKEAQDFLRKCIGAGFKISDIEVKPAQKSPAPPFTTSTLQQEASRKLGFSVTRTMMVAQRLYEAGHITYMRTDSLNLSELALGNVEAQIRKLYGDKYVKVRRYTTKSETAQEAHEAIRPTYAEKMKAGENKDEERLYELIWKRTVASQMENAQLEKTQVTIDISTTPEQLQAEGEVLKFDGFLKVYLESRDDEEDEETSSILPPVKVGQQLSLQEMMATERYNRPPARYTEASLVRKLEELGIGRPSTYAPTINTVQKRGYVMKANKEGEERPYRLLALRDGKITEQTKKEVFGRERAKLFPTNTGVLVNDFLLQHFEHIMDYHFTASVEKQFDEIAHGDKEWRDMLSSFYGPFHNDVETTIKTSNYVKSERLLGPEPKTGKPIFVKTGPYGPYAQKGDTEGNEKPVYARLRKGQLLESITLEDALELFKLPREIGEFEGLPVTVNIGRFGPYVAHNKNFYSLPKDEDPYEIELPKAIEIIQAKSKEKEAIQEWEYKDKPMKIMRGRYGPYVSWNKVNATIPKGTPPEQLSFEEAVKLIEAKGAAGGGAKGGRGAKAAGRGRKKKSE